MMGAPSDDSGPAPLAGHGYLFEKGVFTTIDRPDAVAETVASGINIRRQITGSFEDADGTEHGFLLDDGIFASHRSPGSGPLRTAAIGLDDRRRIISFTHADGPNTGSFWTRGVALGGKAYSPRSITRTPTGTRVWNRRRRHQRPRPDRRLLLDAGATGHDFVRDKGIFTTINHPDAGTGPVPEPWPSPQRPGSDRGQVHRC